MTVSYNMTASDHWGLTRYVYLHDFSQGALLAVVILGLPAWFAYTMRRGGVPPAAAVLSGLICLIIAVPFFYLLLRLVVWQRFRAFPRHMFAIQMTLDEAGIHVISSQAQQQIAWTGVLKVRRDRRSIYLFLSRRMAHVVPLRAFASVADATAFWEFATQHTGASA